MIMLKRLVKAGIQCYELVHIYRSQIRLGLIREVWSGWNMKKNILNRRRTNLSVSELVRLGWSDWKWIGADEICLVSGSR